MKRLRLGRPSPALVISLVALFIALGGTGYAALKLPKNSVGTKQLKKNAVTSTKVKNSSLTGADIKNGSLSGSDIKLSALGPVPAAANAANATNATHADTADNAGHADSSDSVGGVTLRSFSVLGTLTIPNHQVLDLDGLQISASCAGGLVTLTAATTTASSEVSAYSLDASDSDATSNHAQAIDDDFNPGDSFTLPESTHTDAVGQLRFSGANGKFVDVTYNEEDSLGAGATNLCVAHGFAIGN